VVLGVGLGSPGDDFATEILVRVLRDLKIDARNISIDEFGKPPPAGSEPASVAMVYIVGIAADHAQEAYGQAVAKVRLWLPEVAIAAMLLPGLAPSVEQEPLSSGKFDVVVTSFEQAAQSASARIPRGTPKPAQG
jgi:hypothetical protein